MNCTTQNPITYNKKLRIEIAFNSFQYKVLTTVQCITPKQKHGLQDWEKLLEYFN